MMEYIRIIEYVYKKVVSLIFLSPLHITLITDSCLLFCNPFRSGVYSAFCMARNEGFINLCVKTLILHMIT